MSTIMRPAIAATLLEGAGVALRPSEATVAFDEGWSPHVRGQLVVAMPDAGTLELLDPRQHRRVELVASHEYPLSFQPTRTLTCDLGIRLRRINQTTGDVVLELASDEALLMDDVHLDDDPLDYYPQRASLRAIIDAVLARHGAALEPGTADADMTPHWNLTNLFPNPSAELSTASWSPGSNATTTTSTVLASPTPPLGTKTIRWTATAAGTSTVAIGHNGTGYKVVRVSPGRAYTADLHTVVSGVQRACNIELQFFAEDGSTALQATTSPTVTPPSGFVRHTVTAEAPVGAAYAGIVVRIIGCSAAQVLWADAAMIYEGTRQVDVFDGTTPDDANYTYDWDAAAHASSSTRTALQPSDPDALLWQPGVSAWQFLQPLFQRAGLRLFCDHLRRWHLVDGAGYLAEGQAQLSMPGNLHDAVDVTDRDGDWFDAAMARYRGGRIDFYGPPGYTKVRTFDLDTAYPGAGFAEYAVKRAEGRGRTLELVALANLDVRPSQLLTVTLPDTPTLIGLTRAVQLDLTSGTMRVASRAITDVPAGAYVLAADGLTYAAAPAVTYAAWTNPNGA